MERNLRKTGIDIIGDAPWGTHFCQFYQTKEDLVDILVPYFKAGLQNNELCMWVTSEPLRTEEAREALRKQLNDLDDYIAKGQIEIIDYTQWYTKSGRFDPKNVLRGWARKEKQALAKGFDGLRLTGNTFWLEEKHWRQFADYEATVNSIIGNYRMLAICAYSLDRCTPSEIIDVVSNHEFALIRREHKWEIIESAKHKEAVEALRQSDRELRIRNQINNIFLTCPDEQMYARVLELVLEALDSKYGTFGYFDRDGHFVVPAMTREIYWEKCNVPEKDIIFERGRFSGVWGRAVEERKTLYSNTGPFNAPGGHIPIENTMVTPIVYKDEIISAIHVANKPGGYDEKDKSLLEMMADYIAPVLYARLERDRRRKEQEQAEAALRESENKYRTLLKNIPQKIFYKDSNSVYVLCNDSFAEDLKIKPEQIKGKTDYDFFPKELAEKYRAGDKRILESGSMEEIEEQYVKDGKNTAVQTFKAPVKDEQGNTIGIFGIFWDITGRKQAEEALRESERQLSARNRIAETFLTTPDDEIYADVLQILLETMESKYGIFGYIDEQETLVIPSMTRDVWEQCRVADKTIVFPREKWGGIWGRALKEKRSLYANEGLRVPEGHVPIKRVLVVPIMYGRELIGLLEVANKASDYSEKDCQFLEDIAGHIAPILNARLQRDRQQRERKQAEEALKRSEERYALAQRAAHIGSWDWDIVTGKLTWSEQIEPMFGFGKGEFGGTYETFLECVHPDDHRHVVDSVNACIEAEQDYAIEHRIVWPDETVRWVSEKGDVIRDEAGNAVRMLGVVQDITEQKTAEQQLLVHSGILEVINQKEKGQDVIRRILQLVKEFTGFDAVGIRLREGDDYPYFEVNGFSEDFVRRENYLCARDESGHALFDSQGRPVLECVCGNVILGRTDPAAPFFTKGGSFWTNSTTELLKSTSDKERLTRTRNHCNRAGYESVALVPLRSGQEIVGLLQLNDQRRGCFTAEMIHFFEGIGDSIGIGLARIKAEEEIESLAKFPSENPSSILRVASDGTVLYANTPGCDLLEDWGCNVSRHVPKHWHQYISRIIASGSSEELETSCGDRVLSLLVAPVVDAGYVNVYGVDITERKQAEEDLRKYRQHLEELVEGRTAELTAANEQLRREIEQRKRLEREILDVSEREKRLIGQELHDSIGQQLTGIAFMTKVLEQKLAAESPSEAADVAEIEKLVSQAMNQARGLAKGLHPVDLDADSLMSALRELASSTKHLFGISCTFKCDRPVPVDDAQVAINIYRIAQEAVTNAVKHGRAKNIELELRLARDASSLIVRNDGLDFPEGIEPGSSGMGLQIMNHRVEMIDGSLDVRRGDHGGTIVTCVFPNRNH